MKDQQIIQLVDIKNHFKNVLTPSTIKSYCDKKSSGNIEQIAREHANISELIVVALNEAMDLGFRGNPNINLLAENTKKRIDAMEISREQFDALIQYIDFIKYIGVNKFEELHTVAIANITKQNSLKSKLIYMGLNNKINEKELVKLSSDLINLILNKTYYPLNFMEQINLFKEKNTKISTFDENTFLVLNSIALEHCIFETKDMVELTKIMNNQLYKEMLILPENVVEKQKTLIRAFGILIEIITADIDLVLVEQMIFNPDFDFENFKNSNKETETESEPKLESETESEPKDLEERLEQNLPYWINENGENKFINIGLEFFNKSTQENENKIIDPLFVLYNCILESNNYEPYKNKEQLNSFLKQASTLKDESNKPSIKSMIQMNYDNLQQSLRHNKDVKYHKFDVELFKEICLEEVDVLELIKENYKSIKDKIEEQNIISINPVEAKIVEKMTPLCESILSDSVFKHFDLKGIALQLVSNGLENSLSSYMNLIQMVELLENASVKGEKHLNNFKEIYDIIKTEKVTLSFNVENLVEVEEGQNIDSDIETKSDNTKTMPLLSIFEGINDITLLNKEIEFYTLLGKLVLN